MLVVAGVLVAFAGLAMAAEGFRAPAWPLMIHDPYFSIWSPYDSPNEGWSEQWSGNINAVWSAVRVDDNPAFVLTGPWNAVQNTSAASLVSTRVTSTQTAFSFLAGGVAVNVTFTSPMIVDDLELWSRPAAYMTFEVASADSCAHSVQFYVDATAESVIKAKDGLMMWDRVPVPSAGAPLSASAMRMGRDFSGNNPVSGTADQLDWGFVYLLTPEEVAGANLTTALTASAESRQQFANAGTLKAGDSGNSPEPMSQEWIVAAASWDFGTVAPQDARSVFAAYAIDDITAINYFGKLLPPYWRRDLPVNDTRSLPTAMLHDVLNGYQAAKRACDDFDAKNRAMLEKVGGSDYADVTELTYRQALGGLKLAWDPETEWMPVFLKEISSDGDLSTVDVIFPFSPQMVFQSPDILARLLVPVLEYAMNRTDIAYNLPWAPHHLGHYPIGNIKPLEQEQMPMEESGNMLIMLAAIAQQKGGDVSFLEGFWPAINMWANYLNRTLPDPGDQLCTDDFEGPSPHNVQLAAKGIVALAAYSQLAELNGYDNSSTYLSLATQYSNDWVAKAWVAGNATTDGNGHSRLQYNLGPSTWSLKYSSMWARILGLADSLPHANDTIRVQDTTWYYDTQRQEYGVPLDDRAMFTKGDWETWIAAWAMEPDGTPSEVSKFLFSSLRKFANECTTRVPLTDWFFTTKPEWKGFKARPVYGAMYAPVLVAQAAGIDL